MKKTDCIKKKKEYRNSFSIRINNKNLDDENLDSISVRFFTYLINTTFFYRFILFKIFECT